MSVKRATPELTSMPIMPINRPRMIIPTALISEPWARTTAPISPSTISEKYSAGPNCIAKSDSGGAKPATIIVATVPPKNEPSAEIARAAPARPLRAIW